MYVTDIGALCSYTCLDINFENDYRLFYVSALRYNMDVLKWHNEIACYCVYIRCYAMRVETLGM